VPSASARLLWPCACKNDPPAENTEIRVLIRHCQFVWCARPYSLLLSSAGPIKRRLPRGRLCRAEMGTDPATNDDDQLTFALVFESRPPLSFSAVARDSPRFRPIVLSSKARPAMRNHFSLPLTFVHSLFRSVGTECRGAKNVCLFLPGTHKKALPALVHVCPHTIM